MRAKTKRIRARILELLASSAEPANVSREIQNEFDLSVPQVTRYFQGLERDGIIVSTGYGKGKKYNLADPSKENLIHSKTFRYTDLELSGEDQAYEREILPHLHHCNENALACVRHASTELINNVIDHSKANNMTLEIFQKRERISLSIKDDGIGIFESIKKFFKLPNHLEAVAEMTKGKRTTDSIRHAGEGLFFSQRMVDNFLVDANSIKYQYFRDKDDWAILESSRNTGTDVFIEVNHKTATTPETVFDRYSDDDFRFTRSDSFLVQPYFISVGESVVSRSEAKRLMAGAEKFEEVVLDFLGTKYIGQGFADEIFRVYVKLNPNIKVSYKNANSAVSKMINHVKANF